MSIGILCMQVSWCPLTHELIEKLNSGDDAF